MDVMRVEILEDGSVKVTTSEVSAANHTSAERLLDVMQDGLGGETLKRKVVPSLRKKLERELHLLADK